MISENRFDITSPAFIASDALRPILNSGEHVYYVLPIVFLWLLDPYLKSRFSYSLVPDEKYENQKSLLINGLLDDINNIFFKNTNSDIGHSINKTLSRVEECFPDSLSGVFQHVDFCSRRLGALEQRERILKTVLESFANTPLNFESSNLQKFSFDETFNDVVATLAMQSREGGEYSTPLELATLIGRVAASSNHKTYYDPACGTGSILSACSREAKMIGSRIFSLGQEKNGGAWSIAKMNLFLSDSDMSTVILEDSLRSPPINAENSLRNFDVVVSNPPWNMNNWGIEFARHDPYHRFDLGLPSKSNGDFAFILHMLAVLDNSRGLLLVIVPNGTLSRSGGDGVIRRKLIENNFVDAVIALPEKLFFSTGVQANILIIRKGRVNKEIIFIDAKDKFVPLKNRNKLSEKAISEIADVYAMKRNVQGFSLSVTIEEIQRNQFDLSVGRYVSKIQIDELIDLVEVRKKRQEIEKELQEVTGQLEQALSNAEDVCK